MAQMKRKSNAKSKMVNAKQAINKDDSRAARMRKVNAERIKAGKPKRTSSGSAKKQDSKAGQLNKQIKGQKRKKPY